MKLTDTIRSAIWVAVMGDYPKADYRTESNEIVDALSIELLPDALRTAIKRDPKVIDYLKRNYISGNGFATHYAPITPDADVSPVLTRLLQHERFMEVQRLWKEQMKETEAIAKRVKAAIYSCTTDKQLTDRFPEFAKYLPKVAGPTANLPADTNLMTDLMKAGWPKGEAKKDERPAAKAKAKRAARIAEAA